MIRRDIEKGALKVMVVGSSRVIRIPIAEARRYGRPRPIAEDRGHGRRRTNEG